MSKEQILKRSQLDANRDGKAMAVLNLNPYSPLYVIRSWDDRYQGHRDLVAKVCPTDA